ncbi:hypothetical protein IFM89_015763 [Coptis chinensis]|uniref:UFSP2 second domain-containing protein n=1 Tax=Coptis chinensis TaxID=261450 RepID=A0A835LMP6_9MAGN|nr:hypothetical protein IFM89_015763 [Coptis chinensis]
MENNEKDIHVRVLCKKLILITNKEEEESIQWLIGSPFFPQFTILSTFKCLHFQSSNNPNYSKESNNVQSLLLRGFNVIGALLVGNQNNNWEENARRAVESARKLRKLLRRDDDDHVIGASADVTSGEIQYFDSTRMDPISSVVYEDSSPENYIWERGCLLRCGLDVKIPICFPVHNPADSERVFSSGVDDTIVKLRDPNVVFMIEGAQETNGTVIVRGAKLNFQKDVSSYAILCENTSEDRGNSLFCSAFCSKNKPSRESADPIQVSIFFNKSGNPPNCSAPTAEYIPASEPAKHVVSSFKIEVLCYAAKDLPVAYAVSRLIVPGIVDQLISIKKDIMANLLTQHPKSISCPPWWTLNYSPLMVKSKPSPFHFFPPGIMHPVTTIYELSYGETEMKQVEVRRSLHLRLGLPLDRPLLLVANALNFSTHKGVSGNSLMRNASNLLKDVHGEVPSSGVSGGLVSRVDGSYEYYHYLQDGFDDSVMH